MEGYDCDCEQEYGKDFDGEVSVSCYHDSEYESGFVGGASEVARQSFHPDADEVVVVWLSRRAISNEN